MCCKQRSYAIFKFFRCNTYKKHGGRCPTRKTGSTSRTGDLRMQKPLLAGVILAAATAFMVLAPWNGISSPAKVPADEIAILVGAGDIADCKDLSGAEATAKLLDKIPGTVMAVGDLAYPDGSKENFTCYDKTLGRAKSRTRPGPGNHEFRSAGASPYFDYFSAAADDPKTGYVSHQLGTRHIIVLNSECKDV